MQSQKKKKRKKLVFKNEDPVLMLVWLGFSNQFKLTGQVLTPGDS